MVYLKWMHSLTEAKFPLMQHNVRDLLDLKKGFLAILHIDVECVWGVVLSQHDFCGFIKLNSNCQKSQAAHFLM